MRKIIVFYTIVKQNVWIIEQRRIRSIRTERIWLRNVTVRTANSIWTYAVWFCQCFVEIKTTRRRSYCIRHTQSALVPRDTGIRPCYHQGFAYTANGWKLLERVQRKSLSFVKNSLAASPLSFVSENIRGLPRRHAAAIRFIFEFKIRSSTLVSLICSKVHP